MGKATEDTGMPGMKGGTPGNCMTGGIPGGIGIWGIEAGNIPGGGCVIFGGTGN